MAYVFTKSEDRALIEINVPIFNSSNTYFIHQVI